MRRRSSSRNFVIDRRLDAEGCFEPVNHGGECSVPKVPLPSPLSHFSLDRRHLDSRNSTRNDALELGEVGRDVQREPVPRHPLLHVNPDAGDLATHPPPLSHFSLARRHLDSRNSTRNDALELGGAGRDDQAVPVPRHPPLHVYPDAGDLVTPPPRPDTRVGRVPTSGNPDLGQRAHERLLERPEVPMEVGLVAGEVEDRIADELPRSVERNVTPALDLEHVEADGTQQVRGAGVATQRHHGRVLEQEKQVVRQLAIDPGLGQGALPREPLRVGNESGPHHFENACGHTPLPVPCRSSSTPEPAMAHRLAVTPTARLSAPHTSNPGSMRNRSVTAARNPTSNAPTAARTPITPRCHRFSSAWLRRQPNRPATATPASSPARRGSAAASR